MRSCGARWRPLEAVGGRWRPLEAVFRMMDERMVHKE